MLHRLTLLIVFAILVGHPVAGQEVTCPDGYWTKSIIKERIDEIVRSAHPVDVPTRIGAFLTSNLLGFGCDMLLPEVNRQALWDDLIATFLASSDTRLQRGFFYTVEAGFRTPGRHDLRFPMEELVRLVDASSEPLLRELALWTLIALSDRSSVRDYVVSLAHEPEGPRHWPDRPLSVIQRVFMGSPGEEPSLQTLLRAEPDLIRHPGARCFMTDQDAWWHGRCADVVLPPHR